MHFKLFFLCFLSYRHKFVEQLAIHYFKICFLSTFSNITLGDHVNVKRPFQSSENLMSQSFCQDSNFGAVLNSSRSKDSLMTQSLIHESNDSRSIEESLALIQHHVKVNKPTNLLNWQAEVLILI